MDKPHCTANAITWPFYIKKIKITSCRVFSLFATISALFEGIPIRGSEVTSVLVFLFYFILFS
jgi:hypothetical protein